MPALRRIRTMHMIRFHPYKLPVSIPAPIPAPIPEPIHAPIPAHILAHILASFPVYFPASIPAPISAPIPAPIPAPAVPAFASACPLCGYSGFFCPHPLELRANPLAPASTPYKGFNFGSVNTISNNFSFGNSCSAIHPVSVIPTAFPASISQRVPSQRVPSQRVVRKTSYYSTSPRKRVTKGDIRRLAGEKYETDVRTLLETENFKGEFGLKIKRLDGRDLTELDGLIYGEVRCPCDVPIDHSSLIIEMKRSLNPQLWGNYLRQLTVQLTRFSNKIVVVYTKDLSNLDDYKAYITTNIDRKLLSRIRYATSIDELWIYIRPDSIKMEGIISL